MTPSDHLLMGMITGNTSDSSALQNLRYYFLNGHKKRCLSCTVLVGWVQIAGRKDLQGIHFYLAGCSGSGQKKVYVMYTFSWVVWGRCGYQKRSARCTL